MGPFPHDAEKSKITDENPAGTDGFEFVEFASADPQELRDLFTRMGYAHVANHKTQKIELWQQGDITYVLNADPDSFAAGFVAEHGPCAPSMGWRVVDAQKALDHAVAKGAEEYTGAGKVLDVPAIKGIGGAVIYFVYYDTSPYNEEYDWIAQSKPAGVGFYYLDHLTHNVFKGNMDVWFKFYGDLFNFREIRFFDIEGKFTGLTSRALTSPCGRIRIPINEDRDEKGQIVAYLKKYNGEGIQHIAVGARNIYDATDAIADNGMKFMPGPPETYYKMSKDRVTGHQEPLDRMKKHGILIFFEFIERKGDDGFGEGNFKALFESIEQEQIDSGELSEA